MKVETKYIFNLKNVFFELHNTYIANNQKCQKYINLNTFHQKIETAESPFYYVVDQFDYIYI